MAIQQLVQPILNPISAFDSTNRQTIDFVVIGGAQVIANRLVITNNQTGAIVYNATQTTMKLEHTIPANTLTNGTYYNAVVYTIDSANNESEPSVAVPFYCYSTPSLTITNIPETETIENGTYTFTGSYAQLQNERLDSYQYTLYDSNKNILSQTPLIYYSTDSTLSYTFRGMSNDTPYYVELSGETINNTQISSGLIYFTVRYKQPAIFAICDLVNDCNNGFIQISSNIVAIDGKSNPSPPAYIDDKEVDLRRENAWVEWDNGFNIKDDFTMRVWGRDFNPYEKIITLKNNLDTTDNPNKIELKWMIGDVDKNDLTYVPTERLNNVHLTDSNAESIKNLSILGYSRSAQGTIENPCKLYGVGDKKNLINISNFNLAYTQDHFSVRNTGFELVGDYIYTLSFNYRVNSATTDLYYSIGYGTNDYQTDIKANIQYTTQKQGNNKVTFIVPAEIPAGQTLWIKFANTLILADVNIDISNVQLEKGSKATFYQFPSKYEIYPTASNKNLFDKDNVIYLKENNCVYTDINNGYKIEVLESGSESSLILGYNNIFQEGQTYAISFAQTGTLQDYKLYFTALDSQVRGEEIPITNNTFTLPITTDYDIKHGAIQLVFTIDNSTEDNAVEITNIQIEQNSEPTEYVKQVSNSSSIVLDEPLRGMQNYRDMICIKSPNLFNIPLNRAKVEGDTLYTFNQLGNTLYYLWFYNEEDELITFVNEKGEKANGITITKGNFTTHKYCTRISITTENNPSMPITISDISDWWHDQVEIVKAGDLSYIYYPASDYPVLVRYNENIILNGSEDWEQVAGSSGDNCLLFILPKVAARVDTSIVACQSDIFPNKSYDLLENEDSEGIAQSKRAIGIKINKNRGVNNLATFKAFLNTHNVNGVFVMQVPEWFELRDNSNAVALKSLVSYSPITNLFTNNQVLGTLQGEYTNGESVQQFTQAYVQLKCWNMNESMPYVTHSNYIEIPESTDKVFIWLRRKNNIFDLIVENLYDYQEGEKPADTNKPIVTMEIKNSDVTRNSIKVTGNALDDRGLRTIRFSKNNGRSWDKVITIDGVSTTQVYTFTGLQSRALYTIRVEAVDLTGNVGGISQMIITN